MPLKDQFVKKCTGMCRNELFKGLKKRITRLPLSPMRESIFSYKYRREFEVKIGTTGTYAKPIYAKKWFIVVSL
jgi:hypothetical protein